MKLPTKSFLSIFIFCVFVFPVFSQQTVTYFNLDLQNGDLIFVGAEKENLSGAINRVTQTSEAISFDHVGIIEIHQESLFIIHASTRKGSIKEPLDSLVFQKNSFSKTFAIYRLSKDYQYSVNQAIKESKTLLGKPYNWSYVLNDSSLYCSDLVERAFRNAAIFQLEPMTFINPETGKTDAFWTEFYAKQGMDVPEGQLGCNPNGLAASEKLEFIGNLKLSEK